MIKKLYKISFLLFFIICIYSGLCAQGTSIIDEQLSKKLIEYYEAERDKDWKRTYSFRTPLYKSSVPFELYQKKMIKNNDGWKLISFRIIKKLSKGNYAAFRIEFIEQVPDGYFPYNIKKAIRWTDVSTWEKIDGIWFCRDACTRTHLNMNADLVMQNDQKPINLFKIE
jgi:hypothetical protein